MKNFYKKEEITDYFQDGRHELIDKVCGDQGIKWQENKTIQPTEHQKVEKYNCLKAFQICLQKDFNLES